METVKQAIERIKRIKNKEDFIVVGGGGIHAINNNWGKKNKKEIDTIVNKPVKKTFKQVGIYANIYQIVIDKKALEIKKGEI